MLSSTFHDEKLISIAVEDDTLAIEISTQDKIIRIKVSGLEKLRVSDFKEGNIINSVHLVHPERSTNGESAGRSLLKYAYELDDANLQRNAKLSSFLEKKLKDYEDGAILILEVEPSYGAYLVAIGREVSEEGRLI